MPEAGRAASQKEEHSGDSNRWQVSGALQSPAENLESILLLLEQDGSVTTGRVQHLTGVRQVTPLTGEDWNLDAAEVLDQALTEEGHRFLEEKADSQCSFMYLE